MARAGFGGLVLAVIQGAEGGVLVTRRFPGRPFAPEAFTSKTLAALSHLFLALHRLPEPGKVTQEELLSRLERFAESLHDQPEALSLVQALKREVGLAAGVERRFCHRDAWAGNLLLKAPEAEGPEVFLAAVHAARLSPRFFPMLTTAAGTIRPAKVMVMGVGVAGLMAIATAKRLGAQVFAYDVRKAAVEQALSLGAKPIELPISAEGEGGYARELTEEEKRIQHEALREHVAGMDVLITTAQVPGRRAPILLTEDMMERLKPGTVVVDLAAESGGNCVLTKPGEVVEVRGCGFLAP